MTAENQSSIDSLKAAQATVDAALNDINSLESMSQPWSPDLVAKLSSGVLIFTAFALALSSALLWRSKANGMQVLRIFGILCIVGLSAFLLIVGYNKDQLTPIVGLFGAIAGYLLGKESSANNDSSSDAGNNK